MAKILYYGPSAAAIALALWMTAYGSYLSWCHFQSAMGPTIAVLAAVALGIAGYIWRKRWGWALLLGVIGLVAAVVSASVVIDRTFAAHVAGVQAARDANLPRLEAQKALADAKAEVKVAATAAADECSDGPRTRWCRSAKEREKAARLREEAARAKVIAAGAMGDEDPAAVKMAAAIGITPELYRTVQSVSPGVLLEIGAPVLLAFGFHALQGVLQHKAPEPLQRKGSDPLQPPLQRKGPRKGRRKGTRPKYGTAGYWLARLDRDRPDLATRVRNGELSANMAAIRAGMRKSPVQLVAST